MKIKLIMEKRNLTVDLETQKAEQLFNAFALKLLGIEEETVVEQKLPDIVICLLYTSSTPARTILLTAW